MDMETQYRLSFYKIIDTLGGKKNVKLVKHVETGQVYVLKELEVYDLYVYEFIMKSNIPYVPRVYECIESDGMLYVVEEYIHGITLLDYMEKFGRLNVGTACHIARCLCHILKYFHDQKPSVIHRDIKPSNVMLKGNFAKTPCIEEIYLIDFNTARCYDEGVGHDTAPMGTRGFAAPEQYGFSQSDTRTDIYALGVLINYMLTEDLVSGTPYTGDAHICRVIRKATDMSPDGRYQSVDEMLAHIDRPPGQRRARKLLPPGFRQFKVWHMITAGIYYAVLLWFCMTVTVTDSNTGEPVSEGLLAAYRIVYFIMFYGVALIIGNYLDIWKYLPLTRSGNRILKIFGIVLYTVIWVLMVVILFALILVMLGL